MLIIVLIAYNHPSASFRVTVNLNVVEDNT